MILRISSTIFQCFMLTVLYSFAASLPSQDGPAYLGSFPATWPQRCNNHSSLLNGTRLSRYNPFGWRNATQVLGIFMRFLDRARPYGYEPSWYWCMIFQSQRRKVGSWSFLMRPRLGIPPPSKTSWSLRMPPATQGIGEVLARWFPPSLLEGHRTYNVHYCAWL